MDGWINDPDTVASVRELYPPSSEIRPKMENDRRMFLNAMAQIKQGMILGVDTIWTIEWAQHFYKYPITKIELITATSKIGRRSEAKAFRLIAIGGTTKVVP